MTPEETRYIVKRVDALRKAEAEERLAIVKVLVKAASARRF